MQYVTKNALFCIEGTDYKIKHSIVNILNIKSSSNATHIDFTPPSVRPNIRSITKGLLNNTMYISEKVKQSENHAYITYDFLLPYLIAAFFESNYDIVYVYKILERLMQSNEFRIPDYICYVPYKRNELTFGINSFPYALRTAMYGRSMFKQQFAMYSWFCFEAMQKVFSSTTYFDIYKHNKTNITYPIKAVLKNITI